MSGRQLFCCMPEVIEEMILLNISHFPFATLPNSLVRHFVQHLLLLQMQVSIPWNADPQKLNTLQLST